MLKADVDYLCEAFKSSAQFGVVWNITKAVALPTTCHVSSPSVLTTNVNHLTLLCLFPPFFFFFFYFWKILSGLVGRKISSFGISARIFFLLLLMVLLCFPNNDLLAFFWQFQSLLLVLLVRTVFLYFELLER